MSKPWNWNKLRAWRQRNLIKTAAASIGMNSVAFGHVPGGGGMTLGIMFMLYMCLRNGINVGYLLLPMLIMVGIFSIWLGAWQMSSVKATASSSTAVPAGLASEILITLTSHRSLFGLELVSTYNGITQSHTITLEAGKPLTLKIKHVFDRRGLHPAPLLILQTRYPCGLFRCYVRWIPSIHCVVYPAPEKNAPDVCGIPNLHKGGIGSGPLHAEEDIDGVRLYRPGDSLRNIAWRIYAKSDGQHLVSRHRTSMSGPTAMKIRYVDADSSGNTEQTLSRLAAWVLRAHKAGVPFSLQLTNGIEQPSAMGSAHTEKCLTLLAEFAHSA